VLALSKLCRAMKRQEIRKVTTVKMVNSVVCKLPLRIGPG